MGIKGMPVCGDKDEHIVFDSVSVYATVKPISCALLQGNQVKILRYFLFLSLAIVAQTAASYDERRAVEKPVYTGSCETDRKVLLDFAAYWGSGTHGTEQCAYQIDNLIQKQEWLAYVNRSQRCQYDNVTYMPVTSGAYLGMVVDIKDDQTLKAKLEVGIAGLSAAIKCSPNPRQKIELERQKSSVLARLENLSPDLKKDVEARAAAAQALAEREFAKKQAQVEQARAKEQAELQAVAFQKTLERRKQCLEPQMRGQCGCLSFQAAPPGGWKTCGK